MSKSKMVTLDVPKELSNYVESLAYEVKSRADIISFMISHGMASTGDFKAYHDEYTQFYMSYEMAKNEISEKYVKPRFPNCTWRLEFSESRIYVEVTTDAE